MYPAIIKMHQRSCADSFCVLLCHLYDWLMHVYLIFKAYEAVLNINKKYFAAEDNPAKVMILLLSLLQIFTKFSIYLWPHFTILLRHKA